MNDGHQTCRRLGTKACTSKTQEDSEIHEISDRSGMLNRLVHAKELGEALRNQGRCSG